MLIHSPLLRNVDDRSLAEQYNWLLHCWESDRFMLDDTYVFGVELICMSKEVRKFVRWVNYNIVLRIGQYEYEPLKTYEVLLRIATGMLNKLNLPRETKLLIHTNMTSNIHNELDRVMIESLPFIGTPLL